MGRLCAKRGYQKKKAEFIQPARCVGQDRVHPCDEGVIMSNIGFWKTDSIND